MVLSRFHHSFGHAPNNQCGFLVVLEFSGGDSSVPNNQHDFVVVLSRFWSVFCLVAVLSWLRSLAEVALHCVLVSEFGSSHTSQLLVLITLLIAVSIVFLIFGFSGPFEVLHCVFGCIVFLVKKFDRQTDHSKFCIDH